MKKIIKNLVCMLSVLFCIIGFFDWTNIPVMAADESELVISSAEGSKGDEVTVKVTLQSNSGMAGLQFKLKYDKSALSLVSANANESTISDPVVNKDGDGFVGYVFAQANSNTNTGDLLELKFKILDGANSDNLSLEFSDVMGVDNDVQIINVKTTNANIQLLEENNAGDNNAEQNNGNDNNTGMNNETTPNASDYHTNASNNSNNNLATDNQGNIIESSNSLSSDHSENNTEAKSKSKKLIVIIVIIIIIAVAAAIGYIFYNKKKQNHSNDVS